MCLILTCICNIHGINMQNRTASTWFGKKSRVKADHTFCRSQWVIKPYHKLLHCSLSFSKSSLQFQLRGLSFSCSVLSVKSPLLWIFSTIVSTLEGEIKCRWWQSAETQQNYSFNYPTTNMDQRHSPKPSVPSGSQMTSNSHTISLFSWNLSYFCSWSIYFPGTAIKDV